ncbi:MAG: hypothetical protein AAGK97_07340, partial [Bacteroidota bacterium]
NRQKEISFRNHWKNVFNISPEENLDFNLQQEQIVENFINENPLGDLNEASILNMNEKELDDIVEAYGDYNFKFKDIIKNLFYSKLEERIEISKTGFEFLLNNFEKDDRLQTLIKNIPSDLSIFDKMKWDRSFYLIFLKRFHGAKEANDMKAFDAVAKDYFSIGETAMGSAMHFVEAKKEVGRQRLDFYRMNEDYQNYYELADSMISEHIEPLDAAAMKQRDAFMLKSLSLRIKPKEDEVNTPLPLRDSIILKNMGSFDVAERLNNISENIVIHHALTLPLNKALDWINMSLQFIDLPETHLIKASILNKKGLKMESKNEIQIAKQSEIFDESCITKMELLELKQ